MKFKVGEWVRSKENKFDFSLVSIDTEKFYKALGSNFEDEWELWQPKEGEWCWFWYLNCSPVLAQCSGYDGEDYEAIEYSNSINGKRIERVSIYSYCEPFIGNLPSFIKE